LSNSTERARRRLARETVKHVHGMISNLSAYKGQTKGARNRQYYYDFREHKRAIYRLHDAARAKAIVDFALVKSGWTS
jgi:hypothetical protein